MLIFHQLHLCFNSFVVGESRCSLIAQKKEGNDPGDPSQPRAQPTGKPPVEKSHDINELISSRRKTETLTSSG